MMILVAQAKDTSTGNSAPPMDYARLRCTIENFSKLDCNNHYSDIFYAGGYKWKIQIVPKGNYVDFLSMYLVVADSKTLPLGWSICVKFFTLSVINQNPELTVENEAKNHVFNDNGESWGFHTVIPLSELNDPSKGFLVRDACTVEAEVRVNSEEHVKRENREADQVIMPDVY
ncbi:ubiquitin C-terminal hydrolase 12-like [Cannabis sativa]|uniref:ubiquitin C-terminal hydrolase 12-like n=1 Tax=Cannabis sativa TaxID=3483 RepID=UPI0029CA6000|nr:ubiquitin C-terminal hydrolase 12-like [Cannabis sativa]